MTLDGLEQPGFNTTMMGVVKGVLDWYGIETSDAMAFGGSGHAFLVNIHKQVCPSSPYVWKYDGFFRLLGNLGLGVEDLGFFHKDSPPEERTGVERRLRAHLDAGHPCSFGNMENQLIRGYDDEKFLVIKPWDCTKEEITPPMLSYGSWKEFGDECHVAFVAWEKGEPVDRMKTFRESLAYAVDLFRNPGNHSHDDYGVGPAAWDNWAAAMAEHGATHGNWWNATVWSECRKMAGDYFTEMAEQVEGDAATMCRDLAARYGEIAGMLERVADKELPVNDKAALIPDLKARDLAAIEKVKELLAALPG